MALTVKEKFNGRKTTSGNKPSAEFSYLIIAAIGDSDPTEGDLHAALRAQTPGAITLAGSNVRATDWTIDEQLVPAIPGESAGLWMGTVKFASEDSSGGKSEDSGNQFSYSFETTGGTQKIFQSIRVVDSRNAVDASDAPDCKGAINVDGDKVDGVEITVPQYAFGYTFYFKAITDAYKRAVFLLTGKTNTAAFKGCEVGETLFLGAQGSRRGAGDWEISFKFLGSPNVELPAIGDIPAGMKKGGWEYLSVTYEKREVGAGAMKALLALPKFAYVHQVYYAGDYSVLGIGS